MKEYIIRIKEALKDPSIPDVDYISADSLPHIKSFLKMNPRYTYVSEWHDNLFGSRYFIKAHTSETGEYLKKALEESKPIKKPTLISVKSIDDLEVMERAA